MTSVILAKDQSVGTWRIFTKAAVHHKRYTTSHLTVSRTTSTVVTPGTLFYELEKIFGPYYDCRREIESFSSRLHDETTFPSGSLQQQFEPKKRNVGCERVRLRTVERGTENREYVPDISSRNDSVRVFRLCWETDIFLVRCQHYVPLLQYCENHEGCLKTAPLPPSSLSHSTETAFLLSQLRRHIPTVVKKNSEQCDGRDAPNTSTKKKKVEREKQNRVYAKDAFFPSSSVGRRRIKREKKGASLSRRECEPPSFSPPLSLPMKPSETADVVEEFSTSPCFDIYVRSFSSTSFLSEGSPSFTPSLPNSSFFLDKFSPRIGTTPMKRREWWQRWKEKSEPSMPLFSDTMTRYHSMDTREQCTWKRVGVFYVIPSLPLLLCNTHCRAFVKDVSRSPTPRPVGRSALEEKTNKCDVRRWEVTTSRREGKKEEEKKMHDDENRQGKMIATMHGVVVSLGDLLRHYSLLGTAHRRHSTGEKAMMETETMGRCQKAILVAHDATQENGALSVVHTPHYRVKADAVHSSNFSFSSSGFRFAPPSEDVMRWKTAQRRQRISHRRHHYFHSSSTFSSPSASRGLPKEQQSGGKNGLKDSQEIAVDEKSILHADPHANPKSAGTLWTAHPSHGSDHERTYPFYCRSLPPGCFFCPPSLKTFHESVSLALLYRIMAKDSSPSVPPFLFSSSRHRFLGTNRETTTAAEDGEKKRFCAAHEVMKKEEEEEKVVVPSIIGGRGQEDPTAKEMWRFAPTQETMRKAPDEGEKTAAAIPFIPQRQRSSRGMCGQDTTVLAPAAFTAGGGCMDGRRPQPFSPPLPRHEDREATQREASAVEVVLLLSPLPTALHSFPSAAAMALPKCPMTSHKPLTSTQERDRTPLCTMDIHTNANKRNRFHFGSSCSPPCRKGWGTSIYFRMLSYTPPLFLPISTSFTEKKLESTIHSGVKFPAPLTEQRHDHSLHPHRCTRLFSFPDSFQKPSPTVKWKPCIYPSVPLSTSQGNDAEGLPPSSNNGGNREDTLPHCRNSSTPPYGRCRAIRGSTYYAFLHRPTETSLVFCEPNDTPCRKEKNNGYPMNETNHTRSMRGKKKNDKNSEKKDIVLGRFSPAASPIVPRTLFYYAAPDIRCVFMEKQPFPHSSSSFFCSHCASVLRKSRAGKTSHAKKRMFLKYQDETRWCSTSALTSWMEQQGPIFLPSASSRCAERKNGRWKNEAEQKKQNHFYWSQKLLKSFLYEREGSDADSTDSCTHPLENRKPHRSPSRNIQWIVSALPPPSVLLRNPRWRREPYTLAEEMKYGLLEISDASFFASPFRQRVPKKTSIVK